MDCSGAKLFSLAPAVFLYVQQQKQMKIFYFGFEKKQTYENTNGWPMKKPLPDFVGQEMTNGGPMKRP